MSKNNGRKESVLKHMLHASRTDLSTRRLAVFGSSVSSTPQSAQLLLGGILPLLARPKSLPHLTQLSLDPLH